MTEKKASVSLMTAAHASARCATPAGGRAAKPPLTAPSYFCSCTWVLYGVVKAPATACLVAGERSVPEASPDLLGIDEGYTTNMNAAC